ncbi:MAG TPA: hypothetical protein VLF61_02310, partial [Rhabdochlamydiaceae bacterium]|nr:hypothetical protein [Rhabdochlamydiaceae bacterium]
TKTVRLTRAKSLKNKSKKKVPTSFETDDLPGQRRLEGHWDRRHKSEKGYGGPFRSPRYMQDYINAEARHWEQVYGTEGDYGDEGKSRPGNRYSDQSSEEKRHLKEKSDPHRGSGRDMQDIEDEKFDDEDYHPERKTS